MVSTQRSRWEVTTSTTALEIAALEPLVREDLADLLAFALGDRPHVLLLVAAHPRSPLHFGPAPEKVARRHAEPVGEQIGDAEDHDHLGCEAGAERTRRGPRKW